MNQSQFLAIYNTCIRISGCILLKAREKSPAQAAAGFSFSFSLVEKLARDF